MNESDALALVFDRAGGVCECIGGGCPALSHRPDVNRCFGPLRSMETTNFFAVRRFADRSDPENIIALCAACAESPRKNSERILADDAGPPVAREAAEDHAS